MNHEYVHLFSGGVARQVVAGAIISPPLDIFVAPPGGFYRPCHGKCVHAELLSQACKASYH